MDELVAADLIAQERKRKMRLIRDCRTLLEPALRANGEGRTMVVQDHIERVLEYLSAEEA